MMAQDYIVHRVVFPLLFALLFSLICIVVPRCVSVSSCSGSGFGVSSSFCSTFGDVLLNCLRNYKCTMIGWYVNRSQENNLSTTWHSYEALPEALY
ncbi:hypothetical protein RHGRI_008483 [Rhododendron griersonianum]|uniref:Secreted protein n=1 Tax=Rhododendron griersonianum TaxID=479676 RepID=A0AAV6L0E6_9ERIC|nr:hypothetical protein RHGRI_008483 [Rhododendron griersonianum]